MINTEPRRDLEAAVTRRPGIGAQILAFIEVLLLAVWIGSMVFFSFAVAPSAFAVLPSRHLAGLMVTSTITKVEIIGLVIGPLLLLLQAAASRVRGSGGRLRALGMILTAVMTVSAALSRFWVSAKMQSLRNQMGGVIDDVAATDPLRAEFNDLHQYSVALMSVALFAGLAVLFITVRSWLRR